MSIKLDWEVESEGGWNEVGEDSDALKLRRQHIRRVRNSLIIVLIVMLAVGGIIAYRLITVGRQVRIALESTVAAETSALRIGDREAYLAIQSDMGGWQRIQEQTFDRYQAEATQTEITGQIVQMDISADRAAIPDLPPGIEWSTDDLLG